MTLRLAIGLGLLVIGAFCVEGARRCGVDVDDEPRPVRRRSYRPIDTPIARWTKGGDA